jgi:isoleucyl-tRNA synthetase
VLAFTADEAWEFLPGRPSDSVHRSTWEPLAFERPEAERKRWRSLFVLRELALPELEKARQAKTIGKSLEARVTLQGAGEAFAAGADALAELRELLNVSELVVTADGGETPVVTVARASGEKCERCWHWETTVGQAAAHPTLCARCVAAVA